MGFMGDLWLRITNPRLYAAIRLARIITSDEKIMAKLSRRAVSEPVQWFVEEQTWGVHTYGLDVDQIVYFVRGRGDAEMEPARVVSDLGSGRYTVAFDVPEEKLDFTGTA